MCVCTCPLGQGTGLTHVQTAFYAVTFACEDRAHGLRVPGFMDENPGHQSSVLHGKMGIRLLPRCPVVRPEARLATIWSDRVLDLFPFFSALPERPL